MEPTPTRILLVNPNRYHFPPVPPLGLEYLAHALRAQSFQVECLDLCFSEDPFRAMETQLDSFLPHAVGITLRNLDTALYPGTEFFLPEIRELIGRIRQRNDPPILIGGAALPIDPKGILHYVGADAAIVGPGEKTLPEALRGFPHRFSRREGGCAEKSARFFSQCRPR